MTMQKKPFKNTSPIDVSRLVLPTSFPKLPDRWQAQGRLISAKTTGQNLFQSIYAPKDSEFKKGLWVIHGFQEHLGRYFHFPHYLKESFDYIVGIDHQGHGRSGGTRGHIEKFDFYAEDQAQVLTQTMDELNHAGISTEIHGLGHSMGGLVLLRLLTLFPHLGFRRVTLSGPALGIKAKVPLWKKSLGMILNTVWGSFQVPFQVEADHLSHDPKVRTAVLNDQLMNQIASARFYQSFVDTIESTQRDLLTTQTPIQVMIALEDEIVDIEAIDHFFSHAKVKELRVLHYKGMYHEVFNEINKERAFQDLIQWTSQHSSHSFDKSV